MTQRFDFLVAEREELQDALLEFHEDHVMARFPLWDCASPSCIRCLPSLLVRMIRSVGASRQLC